LKNLLLKTALHSFALIDRRRPFDSSHR